MTPNKLSEGVAKPDTVTAEEREWVWGWQGRHEGWGKGKGDGSGTVLYGKDCTKLAGLRSRKVIQKRDKEEECDLERVTC